MGRCFVLMWNFEGEDRSYIAFGDFSSSRLAEQALERAGWKALVNLGRWSLETANGMRLIARLVPLVDKLGLMPF